MINNCIISASQSNYHLPFVFGAIETFLLFIFVLQSQLLIITYLLLSSTANFDDCVRRFNITHSLFHIASSSRVLFQLLSKSPLSIAFPRSKVTLCFIAIQLYSRSQSNPTKITPEEIADAGNESYLFVP